MLLKETIEAHELVDRGDAGGGRVAKYWKKQSDGVKTEVHTVYGEEGKTDFVKLNVPGTDGKANNGTSPTLGVIGRLGGVGARPNEIGSVSDADGAIVAIALGIKLSKMLSRGDRLVGDVIISTHICPNSPTIPHKPVPFMGSPVDMDTMNDLEIDSDMDGILSIDTTKGNKIINHKGFAISPTVKEGYILRTSVDLLKIMDIVTGKRPVTFPLSVQDITPYGNSLHHINSIMQPSTATDSPVVGIATTSGAMVPGVGTGANYPLPLEETTRYALEVAKKFTGGDCCFYNGDEFTRLINMYGPMKRFQTPRKE